MDRPSLPEGDKLAKEKARLAAILKKSKWNCESHPNFPSWAGKFLVFHENGLMVPAADENLKINHHRWAIFDGRTVVGMLGEFLFLFRLSEKGDAFDVLEIGNCFNTKDKRHPTVVQNPSMPRGNSAGNKSQLLGPRC